LKKKLYITLLLGLLSFLLNSPNCFANSQCDCEQEIYVFQEQDTAAFSIFKGSDVYAAQIGCQVTFAQTLSERTVRTYSYRLTQTYTTSLGKRLRHFTSFSNHSSWRIFPTSTPFFCTTSKLFYVYALREIIR
jgi:hypothetical protein